MAKTIQDYKNDYNKAYARGDKAGMDAAHKGAEAIRAKSGYSGGADGSQHIPLSSGNKNTSSGKKTASDISKKKTASSGSSGSSSSGSSHSSSASYSGSSGTYSGSSSEYDTLVSQAAQKAASWHTAKTQEEKDRLHSEAAEINQKLGKTYDPTTGKWSGGYSRPADTVTPGAFNGSADEWDKQDANAKLYAQLWHTADTPEKKNELHELAAAANATLGRTYNPTTGKWYGGYQRPEDTPKPEQLYKDASEDAQKPEQLLSDAFEKYYGDKAAKEREEQIRAANKAAVEKNILALNAQKDKINLAGAAGNAAAEQAYMQSINPNGSLAESLAANGLLTSGLTESSQIAAGNAYQSALNKNNTNVSQQLAEIERAISQAQLSGDLATAEQLQAWYDKVADAALQNVRDIVSNTWQQKNYDLTREGQIAQLTGSYNGVPTLEANRADWEKKYQEAALTGIYNGAPTLEANRTDWEKKYQEAALTGKYNGGLTLEGLASQDQHALDQVTLATAKENYRILLAFGYAEEEARKIALELANEGQRLTNELSRQDILYGEKQLAGK